MTCLGAFKTDSNDLLPQSIDESRVLLESSAGNKFSSDRKGANRGRSRKLRKQYEAGRTFQESAEQPKNLLPLASAQLLSYRPDVCHETCCENLINSVDELCVTENEKRF